MLIIAPYAKKLAEEFYSPIFVDGTFTSGKKTIIHAACVTTTNQIILVGLVLPEAEDGDSVYMLLEALLPSSIPTFMTDEGKGILAAVEHLGRKCRHILCTWHLAKQMPKELVVAGETLRGRAAKDLFYSAARGTLITYKEFIPLLKGTADLHTTLSKIRAKWCRQFSPSPRRDYIATLSEGLNGAIKRQTYLKTQVLLAKTFIRQSAYAYQECSLAARKLPDEGIMPLAKRYISIDREVSTRLICQKRVKSMWHIWVRGKWLRFTW